MRTLYVTFALGEIEPDVSLTNDLGLPESAGTCLPCAVQYLKDKGVWEVDLETMINGELRYVAGQAVTALLGDFRSVGGLPDFARGPHRGWPFQLHEPDVERSPPPDALFREPETAARRLLRRMLAP